MGRQETTTSARVQADKRRVVMWAGDAGKFHPSISKAGYECSGRWHRGKTTRDCERKTGTRKRAGGTKRREAAERARAGWVEREKTRARLPELRRVWLNAGAQLENGRAGDGPGWGSDGSFQPRKRPG